MAFGRRSVYELDGLTTRPLFSCHRREFLGFVRHPCGPHSTVDATQKTPEPIRASTLLPLREKHPRTELIIVAMLRGRGGHRARGYEGVIPCVQTLTKRKLPDAEMHAALRVPELLGFISEEAELPDAHRLALVCRYVWNAAIPVKWEVIPEEKDLRALLELFPGSDAHRDLGCKVRRRLVKRRCG